jgi:hypothetical protein
MLHRRWLGQLRQQQPEHVREPDGSQDGLEGEGIVRGLGVHPDSECGTVWTQPTPDERNRYRTPCFLGAGSWPRRTVILS